MAVRKNLDQIVENIENAKKRVGRTDPVELLAVTKFVDWDLIDQSIDWGIRSIGENKTQDMNKRIDRYKDLLEYHFIGNLQRNKVKEIIGKVKLIHSVGSQRLAKAISDRALYEDLTQDVLIQVNVSKEETKNGIYLEDLDSFVYNILEYPNIRVRGLMTMAPYQADEADLRKIFGSLYKAFEDIKVKNYKEVSMSYLSMGMTQDYEIAIEEGSNIVRIGSAIYGDRTY